MDPHCPGHAAAAGHVSSPHISRSRCPWISPDTNNQREKKGPSLIELTTPKCSISSPLPTSAEEQSPVLLLTQDQVLGTHQPPEGHPPVNLPRMPLRQFQHHRVLLHSSPHGLPISFSGDNTFVTILWEGRLPVMTGNSADSILVAPADNLLAAVNTLHVHIWGGDQIQTWLVVFGDVKAMSHQLLLHKVFTTQGPGCTPSHGVLLCFLSLPQHWL